jgi:NitT/TauT family transport system substrate-binding protein
MSVLRRLSLILLLAVGLVPALRAAEPLKIGYSDWPGWVAWQIAIDKGWLKPADVQFTWMDYVPSMDAFAGGKLDGVCMTNGDALSYGANGTKAVGILVNDFSNGNDMIIAKAGIADLAGLKGKKIGVELNFVEHLLLLKALESAKLTEADVTLVNVPTNDTPQALSTGQVDAIGCWHPLSTQALKQVAGSKPLFTSREVPGLIYDLLYVSPTSLNARKADWQAVVNVWPRIVAFINDPATQGEALAIMAKRTGMSADDYKGVLAGTRLLTPAEGAERITKATTGLDSLLGSTTVVNAFNEKNAVYKAGAAGDLKAYFSTELMAAAK